MKKGITKKRMSKKRSLRKKTRRRNKPKYRGGSIKDDTIFSRITKLNHKVYGDIYTFGDNDGISSHIKNGEIWEENLSQIMAKYYVAGTDILDIGANIGLNSLRADQINKITGTCHLFEPQSDVFLLLNLNTQSLNRKLYNMALSDNYSIISYAQDTNNIGATRIKNNNTTNDKISVLSCNLDSLKFDNKISLIKMDIEENEIKVLNGALSTIKQHMPTIIIESFKENYLSVEKILLDLGYTMAEKLSEDNYVFIPKA